MSNMGFRRGFGPDDFIPRWMGGGDPANDGLVLTADSTKEGGASLQSGTSAGTILATTVYNPGSNTNNDPASTTMVDVDATNLAVTFTAPASGIVVVRLSASAFCNNSIHLWGLRESTTVVAGARALALTQAVTEQVSNLMQFVTMSLRVTGLTSGSSHTYKFSHCRTSGTASQTRYGGSSATDYGAAIMEVIAG